MALIIGDLFNARAITIHDVQIECELVAVLINRDERFFVFIDEYGL